MTKPSLVRADTIDLQKHDAPSTQDHEAPPTGTAPHQAAALRNAGLEAPDDHSDDEKDWNTAEAELMQHFAEDGLTADSLDSSIDLQRQDALAVAQNGGLTGEDADLTDGEADEGMDDDFTDKISSSPSIDDEDIDFEFVYALHTFVATVEGQANATKGDTMVLLDDSNSYWWLVRVVKDSSIGYLPAEHIETPTERLARLNKHRNVDAMLGDPGEKTSNPIRNLMRRRNTKNVTFAAPTYVEASEQEYSTDEDDMDADFFAHELVQQNQQEEKPDDADAPTDSDEDEITVIEPVRTRAEVREVNDNDSHVSSEGTRPSDELVDAKPEVRQTRNGTVRNTDSFYKDETVETRKITLTPNLLRDDTPTARTSNDSRDYKPRVSLEKELNEKAKDDKKKKDKKPSKFSGLFKRKDKKTKGQEEDADELIYGRKAESSPVPSKESEEQLTLDEGQSTPAPQRQPSKLQKQPRPDAAAHSAVEPEAEPASQPSEPASAQATMRLVEPERGEMLAEPSPPAAESKSTGPLSKILRPNGSANEPKPEPVKQAKSRVELDDFDSSTGDEDEFAPSASHAIPGAFPDSAQATPAEKTVDTLAESPVEISPMDASVMLPGLADTSSQEEPPSPLSTPSPDLVDADGSRSPKSASSPASSPAAATWNDAHLRTFFDDDAMIKDLLVVVYDKSAVVPAGPNHPVTGGLFKEETAKLADINTRLDGMLGDWMARKSRTRA